MNLVFAGTPNFSATILTHLFNHQPDIGYQIQGVLTQPDRPAGRGRKLTPSPVKEIAKAHQVPIEQPLSIDSQAIQQVAAWQPDLMIVVAYGLLLPATLLETPSLGCVNIHTSLLPRWRGAAPIQRAIEAGDTQTGVTLMRMTQGLDTGPVLKAHVIDIDSTETTATLEQRLVSSAKILLIDHLSTLMGLPASSRELAMQGQPQQETDACYAHKIHKHEGAIDWSQPALVLDQKIRAFHPNPGCYSFLNSHTDPMRIKIGQATPLPSIQQYSDSPGTLVNVTPDQLWVTTGQGILALESIQCPGSKLLPVKALLNAKSQLFCLGTIFHSSP